MQALPPFLPSSSPTSFFLFLIPERAYRLTHHLSFPPSLPPSLATLYNSPVLEEFVLKTFLKALPPADAELSR